MKVLAIDFDGVIHSYSSGYTGTVPVDPPVPGCREFLRRVQADGWQVVVHTCRGDTPERTQAVKDYLRKWGFPNLPVTHEKPAALVYLSKWVVRCDGDFQKIAGPPRSECELANRARHLKPLPELSEAEWGYIGAMIDGEGCITGGKNRQGRLYVRLMVCNTHGEVLRQVFHDRFGGSYTHRCQNRRAPIYTWQASGIGLQPLFQKLLEMKLLKMKSIQAELALEFFSICRYNGRKGTDFDLLRQQQLVEGLQHMNQRGIWVRHPIEIDDRGIRFEGDWEAVWDLLPRLPWHKDVRALAAPEGGSDGD